MDSFELQPAIAETGAEREREREREKEGMLCSRERNGMLLLGGRGGACPVLERECSVSSYIGSKTHRERERGR